jgi:hypothetical protein
MAVCAGFLLTGCGGAEEGINSASAIPDAPADLATNNPSVSSAAPTDALTAIADRLKKASDLGIAKIAYSITPELGAYGRTLREDGWQIINVSPANLSNEPSTIVILNAESNAIVPDSLHDLFKDFKGVLVIDSNKLIERPKSEIIDRVWDEATASYKDPVETTKKVEEVKTVQENPAADFYTSLTRGGAIQIPLGTGLITSATTKNIMAIEVHPDGGVNGAQPTERGILVNPLLNALTAVEEIEKRNVSNGGDKLTAARAGPPGGWDRVTDFTRDDLGLGIGWSGLD